MTHLGRVITFLLTLTLPIAAGAFQVQLELVAGQPAVPLILPAGVDLEDVRIEQQLLEVLDPTPQPAVRVVTIAGYPLTVPGALRDEPLRVRTVSVLGRQVLLLEASRRSARGQVGRVVVRVTASGDSAGVAPSPLGWRASLPEPAKVMAIVTTSRIQERSSELARYVRWREAGGFEVIVGTERDWDQPVEEGPDRRAERIRRWLRQVRDARGLGYVLLIGSPEPRSGSVPMQLTHPLIELLPYLPPELAEALEPVPTDHFYADLEGDWDLDGDGRYGEYPDDDGPGGVRWEPDALVGRVPVYRDDTAALDTFLAAIIDYESSSAPGYRRRLLLPAAFIGFEGSPSPGGGTYEETNDGAVAAMSVFDAALSLDGEIEPVRLFEEEGLIPSDVDHERPLTIESLLAEWTEGAGLVIAYGHGSTQGTYRAAWLFDANEDGLPDYTEMSQDPFMTSELADYLGDAGRAFTFQSACENGWPEDPRNLGTALLAGGAIATVSASRAAIGGEADFEPAPELGDADTMAYAYSHLLLEGESVGAAMAYLRYGLPADGWDEGGGIEGGYGWLGKFEFNLYGDPVVRLGRCESDLECRDGSLCNGEGRCLDGFCVQGELVDCTHLDGLCMVGRCDAATGTCSAEPRAEGTECDDGMFCTGGDLCTEGVCQGEARDCGDALPGYVSVCLESERRCVLEPESVGPEDAGPDGGDDDAGPGDDADPETATEPPFSAGGGGCSVVGARPGIGGLHRWLSTLL